MHSMESGALSQRLRSQLPLEMCMKCMSVWMFGSRESIFDPIICCNIPCTSLQPKTWGIYLFLFPVVDISDYVTPWKGKHAPFMTVEA